MGMTKKEKGDFHVKLISTLSTLKSTPSVLQLLKICSSSPHPERRLTHCEHTIIIFF